MWTRALDRSVRWSLVLLTTTAAAVHAEETPKWIGPPREATDVCTIACSFETPPVRSARLYAVADFCDAEFFLGAERVAVRRAYETPVDVDVFDFLRAGTSGLRVVLKPVDGPTALFVRLDLELADGTRRTVRSDRTWTLRATGGDEPRPVTVFGSVARFPWGDRAADVSISPWDDYTQWKRAQGDAEATGAATFDLPEGYEIELVHAATDAEGSWVATTFDPEGRVIVAREKRGLLRITLPDEDGQAARVETVNDTLHECRGLVFLDGGLYAMANVDHSLFRLRDSNGDDRFDTVEKLSTLDGDNGHGRNQLTVGPNGRLYAIFGDSVFEPKAARSLPPVPASPTSTERTRSGFLARFDLETREWEVVARGLRNPYGVAFNEHGDPFTYDADAEYDMGSPWYRPTRVLQLVPGGDYGWRRVTRQWPPYDPDRPDMPQPTLDIGKGSPTAVAFGRGSQFPPEYRRAMFALDWAYGRVLAVHLEPRGAGYAGRAEVFLRGRPANVTDLAFGPDGAMYFVTGGRGTQSALYRVAYHGERTQVASPTRQQRDRRQHAARSRVRRRALETVDEHPIAELWKDLGDPDPWTRHAARVAVESRPVEQWVERALGDTQSVSAAEGLLALARVGGEEYRQAVVERVLELPTHEWPERERLTVMFVLDRCLPAAVDGPLAKRVLRWLDPRYPGRSAEWNRQASLLLRRLDAPQLVDRTLPLLLAAETQEDRIHYAFVLRDVREGWDERSRRTYFEQLRRFDEFVGGEGMPTFRKLVQTAALASVPEAERPAYERRLTSAVEPTEVPVRSRVVRKWTQADLDDGLDAVRRGRDYESGRRAFLAARCSACHRVEGRGGVLGPDLATVSRRFAPRDVLRSILEPSRVVAETYRQTTFVLADGRVVTGRPLPGDYRAANLRIGTDPLDPTKVVEFSKSLVEEHRVSPVSPMPKGLLNVLERDEILDLLAYLEAAGDPKHPAFRKRDGD